MTREISLSKALAVVPKPDGQRITKKQYGVTADIISSVRQVFSDNYGQTAQLAQLLKGSTQLESAENIFRFVRKNVRYVLDPQNKQLIRTPADIVHNRTADCKGLSILINSLLANLEIKSAFRFVSFSALPTVTHVYSLAFIDGRTYVLDACLPTFNQEKPYTFKEDYMTEIVHISGFGIKAQMARARMNNPKAPAFRKRRFKGLPHPLAQIAPGETPLNISGFEPAELMELKLHRQGLELERNIAAQTAGISSPLVANLNAGIAGYSAAIAAYEVGDLDAVSAIGNMHAVGFLKKARKAIKKAAKKATTAVKKVATKAATTAKKATRAVRQSKLIKKVATAAHKGIKFAAKAVTAPARLLVKGLGEVFIPKMAPLFLYLFITNPTTISNLPAKVQKKRKKSEKFARFMTRTVGMKEDHFMKLVRNGIMRQYKKSPEQLLQGKVNGSINGTSSGINGIGLAPLLIPVILEVISKIVAAFGKKPTEEETPGEGDIPDLDEDFLEATAPQLRKLSAHLRYKAASQRGEEPGSFQEESRALQDEESVYRQIDNEPAETPYEAPLPMPEPQWHDPYQRSSFQDETDEDYPEENFTKAAPGAPEPGPASSTTSKSSFMLPLLGLVGAAAIFMKK